MIDIETLLRFGSALALVLALIAGLAWAAKRKINPTARGGRRLRVLEAAAVDGRTRLVLVRRDDREHLVLVHPGGAYVVESAISPPPDPDPGASR